jgi:hypothetical protein
VFTSVSTTAHNLMQSASSRPVSSRGALKSHLHLHLGLPTASVNHHLPNDRNIKVWWSTNMKLECQTQSTAIRHKIWWDIKCE